ncbi:MAG: hypothetical protein JWQ93_2346, partial [Marmoricola sp.]|nr:hypothetical protein [Marmoricola sp.]
MVDMNGWVVRRRHRYLAGQYLTA